MKLAETKSIYRDMSGNLGSRWKSKEELDYMTLMKVASKVRVKEERPPSIQWEAADGKIVSEESVDTQSQI